MKVLVTGGAGYIGCLAVQELLASGHQPVVLDTLYWGRQALAPYLDQIELIQGDCRNSRDVLNALEGVEGVVHLAGIVGEPACKINPKAHHTVNIESTRTLVHCCTHPDLDLIKNFVFLSSCSVYGNVKGLYAEVKEDTPLSPLSLYADGKAQSEQIIMQRAQEVPHFTPTILRLTTVFGWSPRPRLDLVTNLFTFQAWKNQKITIFGDGSQYRSLIHVRDIAKSIAQILGAPSFMRKGQVFHVGDEANNKKVKEIAKIVKSILPGTKIEFKDGEPTDRRDYRINCQRLRNVINWKVDYSVERGVQELVEKFETTDMDWDSPFLRNNQFQYD